MRVALAAAVRRRAVSVDPLMSAERGGGEGREIMWCREAAAAMVCSMASSSDNVASSVGHAAMEEWGDA